MVQRTYFINSVSSQPAKTYALENQRRNSPRRVPAGVVSGFNQRVPQRNHISRNVHFGNGGCEFAVLNQKSFNSVGKIAGAAVAVSAIESCNQYAVSDRSDELVEVFGTFFQKQYRRHGDCGFHFHFIGIVRVDVIGLQHAIVEYIPPFCGNPLSIEIPGTRRPDDMRVIHERKLFGAYFLPEFID